jgi:hypothetical protein
MIRFCHCRFQPFTPRKVTAAFNGGRLTSNGDVMLLPSRNFGSARRDARLILILAHHGRLDTSRRESLPWRLFGALRGPCFHCHFAPSEPAFQTGLFIGFNAARPLMTWYWYALLTGLIMPWLVMGKSIRASFRGGPQAGFGTWAGIATLTIPLMLLATWITDKMIR